MKNAPLAFIDLETTGLLLERHEIIEIGLVLVHQHPDRLEVVAEREWKVAPQRIADADPKALEINGYSPEKWENAISLSQALTELSETGQGAVPVGHNVSFDVMFLEKAFEQHMPTGVTISSVFDYHRLDTIPMAYIKLYRDPRVEKFSLRALCDHFGITNQQAHTALSDTRACAELYAHLIELPLIRKG